MQKNKIKNNKIRKTALEYVNCDFCNSNSHQIILTSKDYIFEKVPGIFRLVKCLNCGLIFTNPRLNKKELAKYYSKIVNYENKPQYVYLNSRFSILRRNDLLTYYFNYPILRKSRFRKLIQFPNYLRIWREWKKSCFVPKYIKNGNILEIGCSYGGYLYQLKKIGWNIKGIELNEEAVNYANKKLNLDVMNVSIEDFSSNSKFDFIYLSMVLEHVISPMKVLRKLNSLLKSEGALILSIPNFNGIEVRIFRKYAYIIQLPFHLFHFTPKTIRNYLKALNFKKIRIIYQNSDRDLLAPLNYILRENPNNVSCKILHKLFFNVFIRKTLIKIVINLLSYIGKTSRMTVIAQK
ncbi:MAG: class I SAM-dependent methyltransferase [Candidatus Hodarchaeota archaeon]